MKRKTLEEVERIAHNQAIETLRKFKNNSKPISPAAYPLPFAGQTTP